MSELKGATMAQLNEDWMIELGIITPELLNKVRLVLMVAYPIKKMEIECNTQKATMTFECKFSFFRSLFKKKRLIDQIHARLADRFKNYSITVNLL